MAVRHRPRATRGLTLLVFGVAIGWAGTAAADQWDTATDSDNGTGTDNAPFHGSEQVHDLGALPGPAEDQDWYLLTGHPFSSYQFVVDGMTGDLDLTTTDVQLMNGTGTIIQNGVFSDGGHVLSLNTTRGQGAPVALFARISGASCGTACAGTDRYRVRFYDTTYTIPRFNDSGTQRTVLLIQNATPRTCGINVFFLGPDGQPAAPVVALQLLPHELQLVTSGVAELSGSVRVTHVCGYGGLTGKAVAVEPTTGFTFDTPMLPRPR
jgi:hypothetical protein